MYYNPPLTLLVKPASGLCNLRCAYCFYRGTRPQAEQCVMTPETADRLLQCIAAHRPISLQVVFQGGEPTLAGLSWFRYFIAAVKQTVTCPVRYAIQTNGLLIDDAFAAFFKENGFLVGISLDGPPQINDRFRRDAAGQGAAAPALEALRVLSAHGVPYNILCVVSDETAGSVASVWRFFREAGFRYLQFIPCIDEGSGVSLSSENYARFLKECFDLWYADLIAGRAVSVRHIDNYIGILLGRRPESCAMGGVCGGYYVVEANGDLYPCDFYCREEYRLGNIRDEAPFQPREKLRAFINDSCRIHELCLACRYYLLCRGGCRRDRTEDLLRNRCCAAYRSFFEDALPRMERAAQMLLGEEP